MISSQISDLGLALVNSHKQDVFAVKCFQECFDLLNVRDLVANLNPCPIPTSYLFRRRKKRDHHRSQAFCINVSLIFWSLE